MNPSDVLESDLQKEVIQFAQDLVRIKSYSGQEELIIRFVEQRMKALGYEEVIIDSMGNLLGRMGSGGKSILFDSHVDTVEVNDEQEWEFPPFSGEIVDGKVYIGETTNVYRRHGISLRIDALAIGMNPAHRAKTMFDGMLIKGICAGCRFGRLARSQRLPEQIARSRRR